MEQSSTVVDRCARCSIGSRCIAKHPAPGLNRRFLAVPSGARKEVRSNSMNTNIESHLSPTSRCRRAARLLYTVLCCLLFSIASYAQTLTEFQPNVAYGGRAVAVTVSPTNPSVAIVASESGGLF